MPNNKVSMDKIVSLCKRRGFIFAGSEIYGGLANTWDYGPLGVELKNNVKDAWWNYFVRSRRDMVGIQSSILMNPKVWEASGHLKSFTDPLVDCKACHERHRADHLLEDILGADAVIGKSLEELSESLKENQVKCPACGEKEFTEARMFNLMFKTFQGVLEETADAIYLRPETAQGMFVNFKNVVDTTRKKLPFGIAQIGKSFRNEITPGNFTFRTREFEQMEIEYFVEPGQEMEWYKKWKDSVMDWFVSHGVRDEHLRFRDHEEEELSHYSNATTDLEYEFPWGWGELTGIASRTNYDLTQHQEFSGQDLQYHDQVNNKKFLPYVVEPAFGCDRTILTFLIDAYDEEQLEGDDMRVVMRFHKDIAPIKVAILPLMRKDELEPKVQEVWDELHKVCKVQVDETQSIGKRYRRQDEIGTPYCVTIDYDTLEDNTVTIRERDSMEQERVSINDIRDIVTERLQN